MKNKGYTLIEILVVIAIIMVLVSIVAGNIVNRGKSTNNYRDNNSTYVNTFEEDTLLKLYELKNEYETVTDNNRKEAIKDIWLQKSNTIAHELLTQPLQDFKQTISQ
jgi:prepilin-type N-terminal cleavage/methylation domain-containing protein